MNIVDLSIKNTLLEQIAITPRYRANGLWPDARHVVIFAHREKVAEACHAVLDRCPNVEIAGICAHKGDEEFYAIRHNEREISMPSLEPADLEKMPQCLGVLYWSGAIVPDLLYHLATPAATYRNLVIFPRMPIGVGRKLDAALYDRHGDKLEEIYASLADAESKKVFASVIKALLTGEPDWIRISAFGDYQHPSACARAGDIVIDAGLFDSTVLRRFALTVGPQGHAYGFEPEPANFAFVEKSLEKFGDPGNITLVKKGLYSSRGSMRISAQGPSGSLGLDMDASSPCETVDVDSFVEEMGIEHVDLIKMDIEGAELDALRGAANTIKKWRPRLHICAYHKPDDIVDIPEIIKSMADGYKFYFAAHAPYMNEYVYYCVSQ